MKKISLSFKHLTILLLFIVPFLLMIYNSGSIGLFETSEGRYASSARAMIDSNDWTIPTLNGIKHLTKPPVTLWITAIGLKLFGNNEFGARFFLSIAASLTVIGCYLIGKLLFTNFTGYLGALILTTSLLFLGQSRGLTTDPFLTFFETYMVLAFISFLKKPSKGLSALFWIMASMAMLTKGPPGLLPLLGLIPGAFFINKKEELKLLFKSKYGILTFITLGMGWYFVAAYKTPGLLNYFLVDETLKRVASSSHKRSGPFYMFILLLPVGLFPWTPFLFSGGKKLFASVSEKRTECLLLFWLLIPLLIFTLSKSKLAAYVLPLMIPISIIAATSLTTLLKSFKQNSNSHKYHFVTIIAFIGLLGLGVFYWGMFTDVPNIYLARNALFLSAFWCFLAISAFVFFHLKQKRAVIAIIALFSPGLLLFLLPGLNGSEEFQPNKYLPSQAQLLKKISQLPATQKIICIEEMIEGYYFYTGRELITWNVSRVTKFDINKSKALVLQGNDDLIANVDNDTLLLIRKKDIEKVETILNRTLKILYDKQKWFIARAIRR